MKEADVICCTCAGKSRNSPIQPDFEQFALPGSSLEMISETSFKFIVMDESSQCQDPHLILPLSKLAADGSQLVSDMRRLPHVLCLLLVVRVRCSLETTSNSLPPFYLKAQPQ